MVRRKGKAPGSGTLTYYETKKIGASYGTQKARLDTDGQRIFGDCCLGLSAAIDPCCTPSGHIYSREAIVTYLLTKSKDISKNRLATEQKNAVIRAKKEVENEKKSKKDVDDFYLRDQGPIQKEASIHSKSYDARIGSKISTETKEEGLNKLKTTSYWLSEFNPEYEEEQNATYDPDDQIKITPRRPSSPMSGDPLRLKDLTSLTLRREGDTSEEADKRKTRDPSNSFVTGKVVCAVSGKAISTQPVICLKKSGQVILKDVFLDVVVGGKDKKMACPITGVRIQKRDIIQLQKGVSGFAGSSSGTCGVVAKKYKPTLT
mmetsp:Transcript_27849/g.32113  ORF Transcript_27849/g.32113 Transcript_27849/m.32113 type:complete len:318 (-) Transcript_27849:369-1322(-)|eukprot:CAMPEP_0194357342 /NCGR_PEP_ID=MMETSP0174-20130528/4841_1 /TAXON_ID=216777 /ORGANISM="Proboscia alata, Strain PI-D3" /LENGTH=317 /DNA_ID=CAMNT_0039127321 /DNA_START=82 /DNA_END=1035 /DNA_ORIENTATION=-